MTDNNSAIVRVRIVREQRAGAGSKISRGSHKPTLDAALLRKSVNAAARSMLVEIAASCNVSLGPKVSRVGSELVVSRMNTTEVKKRDGDDGGGLNYGYFGICYGEASSNIPNWTGPYAATEREARTDISVYVSLHMYQDPSLCYVGHVGAPEEPGGGDDDGGGCFDGDTMITAEGGQAIRISELATGARVMSLDSETQRQEPATVTAVHRHLKKPILLVYCAGRRSALAVTGPHRMLTASGWKAASDLRIGDHLISFRDGNRCEEPIVSISKGSDGEVYNLTTEPTHTFLADNYVAHNEKKEDEPTPDQ